MQSRNILAVTAAVFALSSLAVPASATGAGSGTDSSRSAATASATALDTALPGGRPAAGERIINNSGKCLETEKDRKSVV